MPPLGIEVLGPCFLIKMGLNESLHDCVTPRHLLDEVIILKLNEEGLEALALLHLISVQGLQVVLLGNVTHPQQGVVPSCIEASEVVTSELQMAKICEVHHGSFVFTDLEVLMDLPQYLPACEHLSVPVLMLFILH